MVNNGGPAFPLYAPGERFYGMTLRDYFAAKAMQGICANPEMSKFEFVDYAAKLCYHMADAMIEERNK